MTNPIVDPLIGRTVAHYDILARLGGGGMGVVYQARDTRLGRVVALKFLPQQWSHDEDAKQRFIREAQAASATDHRNICTIHDIGTADDGQLFIVMAYYEGVTLKQRLDASGALPLDEALDIATQVAEGLARAHAQGVVHRDIKPGNLILAEDGVRILDFGLATFANALQLTIVGSTLGTAAYMSPEQVRGETAGPASDVWAVGAILYQMLAGHVPFQGAYAEAIAYAIKNETPASLREKRPEIPEEVEQLVFRALHKDASVRYATGRELARALRQVRGQTVPMDLRTEAVDAPQRLAQLTPLPQRRSRTPVIAVAATLLLVVASAAAWVMWPVERTAIVVMPVANLTGNRELEDYRRGLSMLLVQELADSPYVRPIAWSTMLQTLRGVLAAGSDDMSSRKVAQDLVAQTRAAIVVQPTLIANDGEWRMRIEILDRDLTSVPGGTYMSDPLAGSVLVQSTAYRLTRSAAGLVHQHFDRRWDGRSATVKPPTALIRTAEGLRAFEQGLDAYEEQEYPAAAAAFERVASGEAANPVVLAWVSRVARVMRLDTTALAAAKNAEAALMPTTPIADRWFVEAVAAEARGEAETAHERYRTLADSFPDDAAWQVELAAFTDRRAELREEWEVAVRAYGAALALDGALVRPRIERCRLFNRLQDPQRALTEGGMALRAAQTTQWRGAEALARLCLADALRQGKEEERLEAQTHVTEALRLFEQLGFTYNAPRGLFYAGVVQGERGNPGEAVRLLEQAAVAADSAQNLVLRPVVLGNLGVALERLGNGRRAADVYQESARGYAQLGDHRRAARQQINSAALRIKFGEGSAEAFDEARRALDVVSRRGDREFEVTALEIIGDYYRLSARYSEADTALERALQLASTHNLRQKMNSVRMAKARLLFDRGAYAEAKALLEALITESSSSSWPEAVMTLGRAQIRLGELERARQTLTEAERNLGSRPDSQVAAPLALTLGELAVETGNLNEARRHFTAAASHWVETFTQGATVEARARLGWVDAVDRQFARAGVHLTASLERARRMGWTSLEATCRLLLARSYLLQRNAHRAQQLLQELPPESVAGLGVEQQAQWLYWRSKANEAQGAPVGDDRERARLLLAQIRESLPVASRDGFTGRVDIRVMAE